MASRNRPPRCIVKRRPSGLGTMVVVSQTLTPSLDLTETQRNRLFWRMKKIGAARRLRMVYTSIGFTPVGLPVASFQPKRLGITDSVTSAWRVTPLSTVPRAVPGGAGSFAASTPPPLLGLPPPGGAVAAPCAPMAPLG